MRRGWPKPSSRRRFRYCEESVLPCQRDRADLVLDRIGVELEGAIVEEPDQAGPVRDGIADVLGQLGFLRNARELAFQPRLERGDDGGRHVRAGRRGVRRVRSRSKPSFVRNSLNWNTPALPVDRIVWNHDPIVNAGTMRVGQKDLELPRASWS